MFTGLVLEKGLVVHVGPNGVLGIQASFTSELAVGDSVAVNGCCLTVTQKNGAYFFVTCVEETLKKTNLGSLAVNAYVNLERVLTLQAGLGGHLVQGHIDGVGQVVKNEEYLLIKTPLAKELVDKGSVTIDGVSLTVVKTWDTSFSVALIPHTKEVTTLGQKGCNDWVNIEVDIIGKYVKKFCRTSS